MGVTLAYILRARLGEDAPQAALRSPRVLLVCRMFYRKNFAAWTCSSLKMEQTNTAVAAAAAVAFVVGPLTSDTYGDLLFTHVSLDGAGGGV